MRARIVLTVAVLLTLLSRPCAGQTPVAPWFGTWKLNFSKSTDQPNPPRYKRVMSRIEPWEDGLKVLYDMVGTRGGVTHMEWTGRFDGKDYPVQGVDSVLTNAYGPIDDHSYTIVVKVEGMVAATTKIVVSPDRNTLTTITTEKNDRGQDVTRTTVYDRQ